MIETPRRRQKNIKIRSDEAAALLAELARDGRPKVRIIEDALRGEAADTGLAPEA